MGKRWSTLSMVVRRWRGLAVAIGIQGAVAAEPATYELGEIHAIDWERSAFAAGEGLVAFGAPRLNEVQLQDAGAITTRVARLLAPPADVTASGTLDFGAACALGPTTLLVGAPGFKTAGLSTGRVYLYAPDASGVWQAAGILANPLPGTPGFGRRVVAKGDRAFVFAPGSGVDGWIHPYRQGADGTWSPGTSFAYPAGLEAATSAADPAVVGGIEFDGTTLVLGFPRGMNDRGVVTAFRESAGVWSESFRIVGRSGTTDRLGSALCLAGSELLMGAPGQGRGRVARVEITAGPSPAALPDLTLPGWIREAGAALAYQNGRLAVGAPATNFVSSLYAQGAVLLADRTGDGDWEWTGAVTNPWWEQTYFGRQLFAAGNDRFLSWRTGPGGERLQALVPGERVSCLFVPGMLELEEGQARSDLWVATSRPLNVPLVMSMGPGTGSATPGGDFILSGDPEFLWTGATEFDFPVLVVKDSQAEGVEQCRFEEAIVFGADRIGDAPGVEVRDEAVDRGTPPQIIGHLAPFVEAMRKEGYWLAPDRMSMTDDELLVSYSTFATFSQLSNPWILRYLRSPGGAWLKAGELKVTAPTDGPDRNVKMGALAHDESLLLIGEAGDLYARGHLRTFVRDGSGGWLPGASHWPTGIAGGNFGEEIVLAPDRVFVNQGVFMGGVAPQHAGSVHVFSRNGTQLTLQTEIKPVHAGLTGYPWTAVQGRFGQEIAWSAPYLAISFSRPAANGQQSRGLAIFRSEPGSGSYTWMQNFWFESDGSEVNFIEFAGDQLVAGLDGRVLRCYAPDQTTGMFVERPPLAPPGSYAAFDSSNARAAPGGLLVGMYESGALPASAAVPQLAGYERAGDGLSPSLCYGAPFPWYLRPETLSNVTAGGRFAVMHSNDYLFGRREIFILETGTTRPVMTLVPEVPEVESDDDQLRFRLVLDRPSHLAVPVVTRLEGLGGAAANREFAPAQWTRFFEIGQTETEVTFRLLDNPAPSPTAALRAKVESGAGLADPFAASPPVAYRKVKAKVPAATQRIVAGNATDFFFAYAFDGDDVVGAISQSGLFSRARNSRVFETEPLPRQTEPGWFPRADLISSPTVLHGDLLVLGSPRAPGAASTETIQLGRKSGPGAWQLEPVLTSPLPSTSSSYLASHTASNGRYLAVAQNVWNSATYSSTLYFLVYDITGIPARHVGTITSKAPLIGESGYPLVAIDDRDRMFFRDIDSGVSCLSVARLTRDSVELLGRIFATPSPRAPGPAWVGSSIRIAGNRVISSDPGATVDGVVSAGAVYVFEESAGGWRTSQVILPPEPGFVNSFGHATVVERDWLAIGEPGIDGKGRLHFYRFGPSGYRWISTTREFAPPMNNSRDNALGNELMMAKGCVLAQVQEHLPESRQAVYAFDLTVNESFADWCAARGFSPGDGDSDVDGDGLPLRLEWAAGGDPAVRDAWWGKQDDGIWFRVSGDFNAAARVAVEFSEDLSSGSWREVAVRDGLAGWTRQAGVHLELSPDGGERVKVSASGPRGFYRLKEGGP